MRLFDNLCHDTSTDGLASFSDSETHLFFKSNRSNENDFQVNSISRHNHLYASSKSYLSCNVSSSHVKLWLVSCEEWSVATTFLL